MRSSRLRHVSSFSTLFSLRSGISRNRNTMIKSDGVVYGCNRTCGGGGKFFLSKPKMFGSSSSSSSSPIDSKGPAVALTLVLGACTIGWTANMYVKKVGPFEYFASEEEMEKRKKRKARANNDPRKAEVTRRVYLDVRIEAKESGKSDLAKLVSARNDEFQGGRIVVGLFGNDLPQTTRNFYGLCTNGEGSEAEVPSYVGTIFHRIVKGFVIQGGRVGKDDGDDPYPVFPDESFQFAHVRGVLSMANRGPDTNGSQFFICTSPAPSLNGRHVVFGRVLEGEDVLDAIESLGSYSGKPKRVVRVVGCGVLGD